MSAALLGTRLHAAACALSAALIPACTLDQRGLLAAPPDAAGDAFVVDSGNTPGGGGVKLIDGAQVDYSDAGVKPDAGRPKEQDAGPCVHRDDEGKLDCNDTLVENGDFNRTIADWTATSGAILRWVNLDSQGAKGSGSIAVKNAEQGDYDGTVGVAATQCLPATTGTTYDYSATMFIRRGQAFGEGQILVFFYGSEDCSGLVNSAYAVTQVESTEKWLRAAGSLRIPETVRSMGVRLHVEKPFRSEILEVLFDAIRVNAANVPM